MIYYCDDTLTIRDMRIDDAQPLSAAEQSVGYDTEAARFIGRVRDSENGLSVAIVAETGGVPVGYVNVYWNAEHGPFVGKAVPGIIDFGVLEGYRSLGVGSKLMDAAERIAAQRSEMVWLAVGMNTFFGPAQRLYVKRGYVPDGNGVWYKHEICPSGALVRNDDDLELYMIKKLS